MIVCFPDCPEVLFETLKKAEDEMYIEKFSFFNDDEKMYDFWRISKKDFLQSYSYISEVEYDYTVKDIVNRISELIRR